MRLLPAEGAIAAGARAVRAKRLPGQRITIAVGSGRPLIGRHEWLCRQLAITVAPAVPGLIVETALPRVGATIR